MTKVKAHLLSIALIKGNLKLAAHLAMLASIEYGNTVNLDNAYAKVKDAITPKQWSGYLGALAKDGVYAPCTDPDFAGFYGTLTTYA
jgi:hypothetical protein